MLDRLIPWGIAIAKTTRAKQNAHVSIHLFCGNHHGLERPFSSGVWPPAPPGPRRAGPRITLRATQGISTPADPPNFGSEITASRETAWYESFKVSTVQPGWRPEMKLRRVILSWFQMLINLEATKNQENICLR